MNAKMKVLALGVAACTLLTLTISFKNHDKNPLDHDHIEYCGTKGCTFKTLFGEESSAGHYIYKGPEEVKESLQGGLEYLVSAQQKDGGWGAGSHAYQNVMDAHAVSTDPATTATVGMALIRTGNTLKKGLYSEQLQLATEYLLNAVETTPENRAKITSQENTQIQVKLGVNIDAVMTAQFFNNLLNMDDLDNKTEKRVREALSICVKKIENTQNSDGSINGDGWAGVLQSSLASQALEAAEFNDIEVDMDAVERSREYQQSNYDAASGRVNTDRGAGIVLYSVSGSVRASAKEARRAKKLLDDAVADGTISENAPVNQETLEEIGISRDEAAKLTTSYNVYKSAKDKAQEEDVLNGFGNNGGEEFVSFLQTGESMVIAGGDDWKEWYDNTAGRILHIQNENGSWNGHHCITSPVFCTATCLLILSIDQDIENLRALGDS
jgi:hypothetical protein